VKRAVAVSAVAAVLGMTSAWAFEDQELIDYRRHIMVTLGEEVTVINLIVQKKVPDTDFAIQAQALAETAAQAKKSFEAKAEGGNARPEVWQNWADFSKRLDTMTSAAAELAKAAKEGGIAAAGPKVQAAINCNSCHETYLKQKK
jgi:cytochrome c556